MLFRFVTLLGLCLGVQVCFSAPNGSSQCQQRDCMAIVDAGSTGSRVHVYAFDRDENNYPVHVDELYVNKVTPGVSAIRFTKNQVNGYLTQLLAQVPEHNIPIYFYSTAGMRHIPVQQQEDFYQLLKQWFTAQPQWTLMDARTITGGEEGVFGWLATNYQLDLLDDNTKPLTGFIEIGGSSAQLAFPVEDVTGIDKQDLIRVTIYDRSVILFSHSFLGLGANELANRFQDVSVCYPVGYRMPNGAIAQGHGESCQQHVATSINKEDLVHDRAKVAREQSAITLWYTVGAISQLSKKVPLRMTNNQIIAQELLQKSDSIYCQQDWQKQQMDYKGDPYLIKNCLLSAFHYGFTTSLDIKPDQVINTMPQGKEGDWTLGVVLNQGKHHIKPIH